MEGARKTVAEMMGEAFREVAVLIVVFAPLDRWVEHRAYGWTDFWQTFGIRGILLVIGVLLERLRGL